MSVVGIVIRTVLSAAAVFAVRAMNTAHEIVSPLISGPMAAQQLGDSNSAYVGSQVASRLFDGSGASPMVTGVVLLVAFMVIWYGPVSNLFKSEKA